MSEMQFADVIPVLSVRSVPAAIRYYTERLGFVLRFEDHVHAPRYAGVGRDAAVLHLQWHDPVDFRDHVDRLMLRFFVEDADVLYREYRDKGVFHDHTALRDTPWSTRGFAFDDAEGNKLTFCRNL